VTNKCTQAVSYVAIGTDGLGRVAPEDDSVYSGNLGRYRVSWTRAIGNPGFTSVKFEPLFGSFRRGASDVFKVVVTGFDPSKSISVAGHAGSPFNGGTTVFLLGQTTCPTTPTLPSGGSTDQAADTPSYPDVGLSATYDWLASRLSGLWGARDRPG
jgi:hypothetical protein